VTQSEDVPAARSATSDRGHLNNLRAANIAAANGPNVGRPSSPNEAGSARIGPGRAVEVEQPAIDCIDVAGSSPPNAREADRAGAAHRSPAGAIETEDGPRIADGERVGGTVAPDGVKVQRRSRCHRIIAGAAVVEHGTGGADREHVGGTASPDARQILP